MKKIAWLPICVLILSGCYNDKYDKLYPAPATNTCDTSSISYSRDILPIVNASCATSGCHNASGNGTTGGLDFTVFSILQADATQSLLIADIEGTPTRGHNTMPLNLPLLSQCQINKMVAWVNQGAKNN